MTTKNQRRNNGVQNVVAAQKRSNAKTPAAPVAPETMVVGLDASPVNSPAAPATPAEPAASTEPEVPAAPAKPDAEPAAVAGLTTQQEMELIAQGIKTLLQIDSDIDLTPEGLMAVGLRTIRQTLVAILANEDAVEAIRAKKEELVSKAKAWIAEATATEPEAPAAEPAAPAAPAEPAAPAPAAGVRQEPRVVATGSLARWLPTGQMANRVHLHAEDKLIGVEGEYANYRWYKIGGELVWDYK